MQIRFCDNLNLEDLEGSMFCHVNEQYVWYFEVGFTLCVP